MIQLHNLEQEYIHLMNIIEDAGGEITPETEEALTINEQGLETTVLSYIGVMNILESNVDMANKEIERIKAFKEVKVNACDRFKKSLLQALLLYGNEDKKGIKRLEYETVRLSTRKSEFIDIIDENSIDEKFTKFDLSKLNSTQYKKIVEILPELAGTGKIKISKTDIKNTIKTGVTVEGAELGKKFGLTIK